jgi:anti-sigma regulatory factor (Ser/Thr protein kinase)
MELYNIYTRFKEETESLYLLGYFSDEITVPLIELSNNQNADFAKISKRLSFLTAESFQNIVRHGYSETDQEEKVKFGMFSFSKTDDALILCTSNLITNDKVVSLDHELKELNKLDSVQLKSKYLEVLTNNQRTENGGAGIGFISILRKIKSKIDYKINSIDDNISNFLFQSNLSNLKDKESVINDRFIAEDHYNFMNDNNFLLFRKGIFDHSTMLIMTDLLSVKLNLNTKSDKNKILFFVIGELIQNIYNHGYESEKGHEGIFIVRKEDGKLALSAGNFILTKEKDRISNLFNEINSLNLDQVKVALKNKLLEFPKITNEKLSSGIGLLEIKKLINTEIKHTVTQVSNELSYLSVEIKNLCE